jgi:purine-nucleoside phosphorylase
MMDERLLRIEEVSTALRRTFGEAPALAVVLGSGMGTVLGRMEVLHQVRREDLGLRPTGVSGHAGTVALARWEGKNVLVFSGRLHLYEGHPVAEVVLGARAIAHWGTKNLILSSAVGGIRPEWPVGSLVRICDHINLSGVNPLSGPNLPPGTRFPDLGSLYSPRLRALLPQLPEAVYAAMSGPSYESPAEIRMLRTMGADVVGMSMVHEAIAAHHHGLQVLGLAVVSNPAAGLAAEPLAHQDVEAAVARAVETFCSALAQVVRSC